METVATEKHSRCYLEGYRHSSFFLRSGSASMITNICEKTIVIFGLRLYPDVVVFLKGGFFKYHLDKYYNQQWNFILLCVVGVCPDDHNQEKSFYCNLSDLLKQWASATLAVVRSNSVSDNNFSPKLLLCVLIVDPTTFNTIQ